MLRKTGVHFPYNTVFAGMCLIALPATPTLAGTANHSSLITASTNAPEPLSVAANRAVSETSGGFLPVNRATNNAASALTPEKSAPLTPVTSTAVIHAAGSDAGQRLTQNSVPDSGSSSGGFLRKNNPTPTASTLTINTSPSARLTEGLIAPQDKKAVNNANSNLTINDTGITAQDKNTNTANVKALFSGASTGTVQNATGLLAGNHRRENTDSTTQSTAQPLSSDAGTAFLKRDNTASTRSGGLFSGNTAAATAGTQVTSGDTVVSGASDSSTQPRSAQVFSTSTSQSNTIISTLEPDDPGVLVNGGSVTLTESAIVTAGDGSAGISTSNGGAVDAKRTLIATAGMGAAGVSTISGAVMLNESAILTAGAGGAGIFSAQGGAVSATNTAIATAGTGGAGVAAIAGSATLTSSKIITIGDYGAGIFAAAGSTLNAASTSVTTTGENATGVLSHGSTVTLSDGPITTHGNDSDGIFSAARGSVEATNTAVTTMGDNAHGVVADNGTVTLTDSTINTSGSASTGILSAAEGSVNATDTAVTTAGDNAHGVFADNGTVTLTDGSVNTSGSASTGIFSTAEGRVDAANTAVTTAGDNAHGVLANNSTVTLADSTVNTSGRASTGVFSDTAGTIDATNTTVITTGENANGVYANSGTVMLTDSTINTSGTASTGIFSDTAGTIDATNTTVITTGENANGVFANNGTVTLTDSQVNTRGSGSAGIFSDTAGAINATNTTVITTGESANGVFANNGTVTLADSLVNTRGSGSAGIFSGSAGTINATNTTVVTTGENANGVFANNGTVTLNDSTINTSGTASAGILSDTAGTINATNTTVTTTGESANGVFADNGTVTLNDSSVNTRGSGSTGIFSGAAGTIDATSTTVITAGESANGVFANNGTVTLNDSSVNTRGSGSTGIFSGAAGTIDATNTTVITAGESANGVFADNGTVTLNDSSVNTRGTGSTGIFSGAAGTIDAINTTVTTAGNHAHGIFAGSSSSISGATSLVSRSADSAGTIAATGATIMTGGENAHGVFADNGTVTLTDSSVTTRGTGSVGLFSGASGTIDATGTRVITAGEEAYALSVGQGTVSVTNGLLMTDNAAGIFAAGNHSTSQAGDVNLNAVTVDAAHASVLSRGGMLNLNAADTTFNSATGLVLDVQTDTTGPNVFSNVTLTANNSTLNGSLVSDSTLNTSDVTLSNNSSLTGHSQNISSIALDGTSKWYMSANSDVQSLTNNGTIVFSEPTSDNYKTLTVNGNYAGNGGLLIMNTRLGDDSSPTDRLIVTGNVEAGDTLVSVNNMGGQGALTVEGIEVVSVGGISEGRFLKSGRIVAGAYDYELEKVNESWYLTSKAPTVIDPGVTPPDTSDPGPGPGPGSESQYRPETGAYLANLLAANTLFEHRMQDRLGEGGYARSGESERANGLWMRHVGGHNRFYDDSGQLKARTNRYVLQLGVDLAQWSSDGNDRWHMGVMGGYGNAQSNIRSELTGYRADSTIDGYSAGVYATWVESAKDLSGAYVDGWVLYNWLRNTIHGEQLATERYDAKGFTASLEAGYTVPVTQGEHVSSWLQPKAQLTWMGVRADSHREHNGTWVTDDTDGVLRSRLGVRAYLKGHSELDNDTGRDFQPFIEANWLHNFNDYSVTMDDVTNSIAGNKNIGELKLGVEGKIANDFTMWGNVTQQVGSDGYSDTSVIFGSRLNFR